MQTLTTDCMRYLYQIKPQDAYCVVGILKEDLFPKEEYAFVHGQADLKHGVALFSCARLGEGGPGRVKRKGAIVGTPLWMRRCCAVMCHEVCHLLGIDHCDGEDCVMHQVKSIEDSDKRPMRLCQKDLYRLLDAVQKPHEDRDIRLEVVRRDKMCASFYKMMNWREEADWHLKNRLRLREGYEMDAKKKEPPTQEAQPSPILMRRRLRINISPLEELIGVSKPVVAQSGSHKAPEKDGRRIEGLSKKDQDQDGRRIEGLSKPMREEPQQDEGRGMSTTGAGFSSISDCLSPQERVQAIIEATHTRASARGEIGITSLLSQKPIPELDLFMRSEQAPFMTSDKVRNALLHLDELQGRNEIEYSSDKEAVQCHVLHDNVIVVAELPNCYTKTKRLPPPPVPRPHPKTDTTRSTSTINDIAVVGVNKEALDALIKRAKGSNGPGLRPPKCAQPSSPPLARHAGPLALNFEIKV